MLGLMGFLISPSYLPISPYISLISPCISPGRLAMLGLMGFLSEATVPGSVPALSGLVKSYSGEVMAPFASNVFALDAAQSVRTQTHEPEAEP